MSTSNGDPTTETLQALLDAQQAAFNQASVGRTLPVLLEAKGRKPGQLTGRSPAMQAVHLEAPERLLGRIVETRILAARPNSLSGRLLGPAAACGPAGGQGLANAEVRA